MANRSYLYSIDEIPKKGEKTPVKGLSEWSWKIPLAHIVLVSGSTSLCDSIIFDTQEKVSLVGYYSEGVENLKSLFEILKTNNIQNPEVFNRMCRETMDFLDRGDLKKRYILLEPGEILEISGGLNELSARIILEDAASLASMIKVKDLEGINKYAGDDLRTHWEDLLGITGWSDVLYFDFG